MINFTSSLNRNEEQHGVRATALAQRFVATPMTDWAPGPAGPASIRPEDCAEVVRSAAAAGGPYARLPHVVIERVDSAALGG